MFSLRFKHWLLTPEWGPSLVLLLVLPLLLSLGFWQLHRAEEKRQLLGQYNLRIQQPPEVLTGHEPDYTPVSVTGYYDNQHTILIDNQFYHHQVGYDVISPFMDTGSGRVVLVNRGWIPRLSVADKLPVVPPALGQQTIIGLVHKPKSTFVLAHARFASVWPWITEELRVKEIQAVLGKSLYPSVVLLSPEAASGFVRQWGFVTAVPPERHQAYAMQWFILALILVIIYIKLSIRRLAIPS